MRATLPILSCILCVACSFDTSGLPAGGNDDANPLADAPVGIDAAPGIDAALPDATPPDALPIDAPPADAPPIICTTDELRCTGDELERCNGGTAWDLEQSCDLGCDSVNVPAHCDDVVPSNGIPTGTLYQGTAVLTSVDGFIFYTDTGEITSADGQTTIRAAVTGLDADIFYQTLPQVGGPSIGVFSMTTLELQTGHELRAIGANALAIATSGSITISGVIDLTGGQVACPGSGLANRCAGPGGNQGGNSDADAAGSGGGGGGSGGGGSAGESGGGGGGHGGVGGPGGDASNRIGGVGGSAYGMVSLEPLTGGGGGGGGGNEGGGTGGKGGGGGGAVQLISHVSITIDAAGPCGINAGGAGARGSGNSGGGGGGGAGGGILLEAPAVVLGANCVLAANGGGGSAAGNGQAGDPGALGDQPAAGGTTGGTDGGDGAAGATVDGSDGVDDTNGDAGGAGAGAGIIRVNTQAGTGFTAAGTQSPATGTGRATDGILTID